MGPGKRHAKRDREHEHDGVLGDVERLLLFAGGAVIGLLAGRAATSSQGESKPTTAAPSSAIPKQLVEHPSAIPQSLHVSEKPAHERSEVSLVMLGGVLLVLVIGAFVVHATLWQWLQSINGPAKIDDVTQWKVVAQRASSAPRQFPELQISPPRDLQEFVARQEQQLQATGANTNSSVARIPIERAMALVAEKGIPKWRGTNGSAGGISPLELQRQRASDAQGGRR